MTPGVVQPAFDLGFARRTAGTLLASWKTFALAGILISALGLRLAGVDSGLPLIFNLDEATVVEHSLALNWNDLNPHAFMYGSFPFYVLKLAMGIDRFFASIIRGNPLTLPDYYLLSRLVSVALGTANVYLAFLLGKMLGNDLVGLLSAAIFAISPLAVGVSHYATVDSMMGFWCALAFIGMLSWLRGNDRALVLASIATGLAIATKYNAAILLVPIFLIALGLERSKLGEAISRFRKYTFAALVFIGSVIFVGVILRRSDVLNLIASWTTRGELQPAYIQIFDKMLVGFSIAVILGLVLVLGVARNWRWSSGIVQFLTSSQLVKPIFIIGIIFLLAAPFVLLDLPSFIRDFFFQVNKNLSGGIVGYAPGSRSYQALLGEESSAFNPLQYIWAIEGEWGLFVFAAIFVGLWALWKQDRRAFIPFGGLVFLMLFGSMTWRYQATRYLFPMWTLLALFGALGIADASRIFFSSIKIPWISRAAIIALLVVALQAPLRASVDEVSYGFLTPDTRNLALGWVEKNVPPGKFILREWDTPEIERASSAYRVHYTGFPFEEATLAEWNARGVNLVLISAERYDFYREHSANFKDVLAEYDRLKNENRLVQSFEPSPGIKGPPIYVYFIN